MSVEAEPLLLGTPLRVAIENGGRDVVRQSKAKT